MEKEQTIRNSQRVSDLQEFYLMLDKLHTLALKTDNPVFMDAIAKNKLDIIAFINTAQVQQ